jgi:hypothetical protein
MLFCLEQLVVVIKENAVYYNAVLFGKAGCCD